MLGGGGGGGGRGGKVDGWEGNLGTWQERDGSRAEQETTKQAGHGADDGHSAGDICCSLTLQQTCE